MYFLGKYSWYDLLDVNIYVHEQMKHFQWRVIQIWFGFLFTRYFTKLVLIIAFFVDVAATIFFSKDGIKLADFVVFVATKNKFKI